jgi:hypothetical protein
MVNLEAFEALYKEVNMKRKSLLLLLALASTVALAQGPGMGQGPMSRYDASKEVTITGTIETIQTLDGPNAWLFALENWSCRNRARRR